MYFCHSTWCAAGQLLLLIFLLATLTINNPRGMEQQEQEEDSDKMLLDHHESVSTTSSLSNSSAFVTAGYIPDYRFYMNHLNHTVMHLTDLILFSIDVKPVLGRNGMLRDACCLSDSHFVKAKQAKAYRKEQQQHQKQLQTIEASSQTTTTTKHDDELRLWVSIGGAGRSNGYKELYNNNNKTVIKDFVYDILTLVREHDLSGIDFDNEDITSQVDFVQYTKLLSNLIIPTLKKYQLNLLISITLHVGMTLPSSLYKMIDRINLMTYDLPHAEIESVEKHVDTLIQSAAAGAIDKDNSSSSSSIASKIVLGFPAYGRHRQKVHEVKTFADIIDDSFKSSTNDEVLLSSSSRNIIIDTRTEWQNYIYDSPQVVRQKALLAKSKGLAGIFMWELGQDKADPDLAPGGFLVQAMSSSSVGTTMTMTTRSEQQLQPHQQQGNADPRSNTQQQAGNSEL